MAEWKDWGSMSFFKLKNGLFIQVGVGPALMYGANFCGQAYPLTSTKLDAAKSEALTWARELLTTALAELETSK